jgi:hypothetical protein
MFALIMFVQLSQPNLPPNQYQISWEVVARYQTDDECMKAKAEIIKNNKETNKHAYECLEINK